MLPYWVLLNEMPRNDATGKATTRVMLPQRLVRVKLIGTAFVFDTKCLVCHCR